MRKPKLLFYYSNDIAKPYVGGAGFRFCRAIDLLKDHCEITVALPGRPDWCSLNDKYGSRIKNGEVKVILVKAQSGWFRLRSCFACYGPLDRVIGQEAQKNDLSVCFTNFGHFGIPSLHFLIGLDIFNTVGIKGPVLKCWSPSFIGSKATVVSMFRKLAHSLVSCLNIIFFRKNFFIKKCVKNGDRLVANSMWLASYFEKEGMSLDVLYPPVISSFHYVPLCERRSDFVCIGRIHEIKRIERMIDILKNLRKLGVWSSDFHIVGELDDTPYTKYIRDIAKRHPWVILEGKLVGRKKEALLTSCKYAIHACDVEAFGISVAEYLKAGCIPFVPAKCGASEVVERDELCYHNEEDMIRKFRDFCNQDDEDQLRLQSQLVKRGECFSLDLFDTHFLAIVNEELSKRGFADSL